MRAAVPLLKQAVGGRLEQSSQQVAPQLCCALARLCAQSTQGGRAFAAHIFKECMPLTPAGFLFPPPACPHGPQTAMRAVRCKLMCILLRMRSAGGAFAASRTVRWMHAPLAGAAHLAKLAKSEETRAAAGPALLLCQLVLSEQPAPSKARYPPVPPSSTLKISSVFVQLGVVDALRQRLSEAVDKLKPNSACEASHPPAIPSNECLSRVPLELCWKSAADVCMYS